MSHNHVCTPQQLCVAKTAKSPLLTARLSAGNIARPGESRTHPTLFTPATLPTGSPALQIGMQFSVRMEVLGSLATDGAIAFSSMWPPAASNEIQRLSYDDVIVDDDDGNDDERAHSQAHTPAGAVDCGSITRISVPSSEAPRGTDTLTHTRHDDEPLVLLSI